MDDTEYFLNYIEVFNVIFASTSEDKVYIKDANFKYQAMTNKMIKLLGGNELNDVINKDISNIADAMPLSDTNIVKNLIKQDMQIQRTKKSKIYLQVIFTNGEDKIWLQRKTPIINPATKNFVGIRGQITKLIWTHAVKILFRMHKSNGLLINHKNDTHNPLIEYPINSAQHMVLFLCINNYSYSEISILLDEFGHTTTPIRVNDYLEQLKLIFHVRSKTQLIEKAIGLGFHAFLPNGLFNKLSSLEIMEEDVATICNSSTAQNKK